MGGGLPLEEREPGLVVFAQAQRSGSGSQRVLNIDLSASAAAKTFKRTFWGRSKSHGQRSSIFACKFFRIALADLARSLVARGSSAERKSTRLV